MPEHDRIEARDVQADGDSGHAEDDGPEQELIVPQVFEHVRVGVPITHTKGKHQRQCNMQRRRRLTV